MSLRSDIRDYFTQEAASFPAPAGLRASVTAEAARDLPAGRGGMRLAAVVAAALAVAIVTGLIAAGALRHVNAPVPGIRAGQHGMVLAATAVDESHGWTLLTECVANVAVVTDMCPYWVESTNDGGGTWVSPVKIGSYPLTDGDAPRHIHFVDATNGFVFGNGVALATHDGGHTWQSVFASAQGVVSITGSGTAWAVLYLCDKGNICPYTVEHSTDGGRTWRAASPLPQGFGPSAVTPLGSGGLLVSGYGAGDMVVTRDAGRTWRAIPGRCTADALASYVAAPTPDEIWQYCAEPGAVPDRLDVSEDGGATWSSRATIGQPTTGGILLSQAAGTAFLVTSTTDNVTSHLWVSGDGGRSWQAVPSAGAFTAVSFGDRVAWAVDDEYSIWASQDGGFTWTKLPAQP